MYTVVINTRGLHKTWRSRGWLSQVPRVVEAGLGVTSVESLLTGQRSIFTLAV